MSCCYRLMKIFTAGYLQAYKTQAAHRIFVYSAIVCTGYRPQNDFLLPNERKLTWRALYLAEKPTDL